MYERGLGGAIILNFLIQDLDIDDKSASLKGNF